MKKNVLVDKFIKKFPLPVQNKLHQIRNAIQEVVPDETIEKISYRIPTYFYHENLVHFAAFKDHLSFFPTSSGVEKFKKELTKYKISKGTIQIPLNEDVPTALIKKIVLFRLQQVKKGINI